MSLFARCPGLDGQSVDFVAEQIGKRRVDRTLAGKPVHAMELRGDDFDRKVAFPAAVVAGMALMLPAVITDGQLVRLQRTSQPFDDLALDWTG